MCVADCSSDLGLFLVTTWGKCPSLAFVSGNPLIRLNAVPPRTNPLWSQQCFSAEFQVCVSILTICTALALAVVGGLIKGQGGG